MIDGVVVLEIKDRIVKVFDACKRDDALEVDDGDVFQSLVGMNSGKVDDSFVGKRCKNRFVDGLQLEFAICFPFSELEKTWTLEALTGYLEERSFQRSDNLRLAKKRYAEVKGVDVFMLIVVMIGCLVWLVAYGWVFELLIGVVAIAVLGGAYLRYLEIVYYKKLVRVIEGVKVVRIH